MRPSLLIAGIGLMMSVVGCDRGGGSGSDLAGTVKVDGSSTVAPITMVAAEMFQEAHPRVRVTVGISGTGGGFKKFLDADASLRTDVNDASRAIKPPELQRAEQLKVQFIELPVAMDGIALVVNPKNTFCDFLTVAELKRIWEPNSKITNWKDIRDGFPDLPLKLYGPGTDSGTFDYFTEAINGKEKASRSDFTMSEDDNVLVQGVEGDAGALGYFGFAYYEANKAELKLLGVDSGDGKPVKPDIEAIRKGTYKPLARPLFLYVNTTSLNRPEVAAFLDFYFEHIKKIVEHEKVNYVALDEDVYPVIVRRLEARTPGTAMIHGGHGPLDLERLYAPAAPTTQPRTEAATQPG